jgi:hypothetical protein
LLSFFLTSVLRFGTKFAILLESVEPLFICCFQETITELHGGRKVSYSQDNNKCPPEISSSLCVDLKEVGLLEPFFLPILKNPFLLANSRSAVQEFAKFDDVNKSHVLR